MKILIVGLGSIAQKHINAIMKLMPAAEIVALRHSGNSSPYKGIRSVYSWNEIDFFPYFILISNPTSEHAATIKKALDFKCPLFIEKPSLNKLDDANELLGIIKTNKIITYTGCDMRFHPALQFIKTYLIENRPIINEVNSYCGSYLPDWRKNVDYKTVYSAIPELGGGVHLDLIHEPDYCYWLFGKPVSSNNYFRNKSDLNIDAFDYANIIWEYENFSISIILNYYRRDVKRTLEIVTSQTTLMVDFILGTVSNTEGNILYRTQSDTRDIYEMQMSHFINCINQKKDSINTFEESVEILKTLLK